MTSKKNDSTVGWILVCAQFLLIAVLIVQVLVIPVFSVLLGATGGALLLAGLALFALTQYVNRPGNWSVHPLPKDNAELVTGGPYKLVRHPMYSAALLCAAGATLMALNLIAVICTLGLVVVFVLKINIEEREMAAKFPEWDAYTTRTNRLIPNLW